MLTFNKTGEYEPLCKVTLSKEKFPIAFANKVKELIGEGLNRKEAEIEASKMETELELYYEPGYGMFAVDSEVCDGLSSVYSPYTGEKLRERISVDSMESNGWEINDKESKYGIRCWEKKCVVGKNTFFCSLLDLSNTPGRIWNVHVDNDRFETVGSADVETFEQIDDLLKILAHD